MKETAPSELPSAPAPETKAAAPLMVLPPAVPVAAPAISPIVPVAIGVGAVAVVIALLR